MTEPPSALEARSLAMARARHQSVRPLRRVSVRHWLLLACFLGTLPWLLQEWRTWSPSGFFCDRHHNSVDSPAFAWPTRPVRRTQGPTKKSKQNLVNLLKDKYTWPGKTLWAIQNMKKFEFFTSSWEYVLGIKKLTQVGLLDDAVRLWKRMNERGIEPTPASYSAAIVVFNSRGEWERAIQLLDEMEMQNMAPLPIGCEHALMALERGSLWKKSLALMDRMYEFGYDVDEKLAMPVIRACENAGEFELGDKLFWQFRESAKMIKAEEELDERPVSDKKPPLAPPAPWRLPNAVALDAYDPPDWGKKKARQAQLPDESTTSQEQLTEESTTS